MEPSHRRCVSRFNRELLPSIDVLGVACIGRAIDPIIGRRAFSCSCRSWRSRNNDAARSATIGTRRMTPKRQLRYESLEGRRLLATDLGADAVFPGDPIDVELRSHPLLATSPFDSAAIIAAGDFSSQGMIHENDGRVVVVDSSHRSGFASRLWIFQRGEDGALGPARGVIDPGFHVDQMLIQGDQAVVFGTQWSWGSDQTEAQSPAVADQPQTLVATIDLESQPDPTRAAIQQTVPGILKELHRAGEQLLMVMHSPPSTTEIPSSPTSAETVHAFALTEAGLQEITSQQIDPGIVQVRGDRLLNLTTFGDSIDSPSGAFSDPLASPHNWITQYAIGGQSIAPVAQIDLGSGWIGSFQIASDQTATAIRTDRSDDATIVTAVDLLDLSGDEIRLFDSLHVANFAGYAIAAQPDFVLLYDQATPDWLVLVDTQPRSAASTERVRRIEIDSDLTLHPAGLRLSNDRVAIAATRPQHADPIDRLRDLSLDAQRSSDLLLLTISLQDATLQAISRLGSIADRPQLHAIDADADRIGLFVDQFESAATGPGFLFGRLDSRGRFVADGIVRDLEPQDDIDIDALRLLARRDGRLVQHRWDQPDQPQIDLPLDPADYGAT